MLTLLAPLRVIAVCGAAAPSGSGPGACGLRTGSGAGPSSGAATSAFAVCVPWERRRPRWPVKPSDLGAPASPPAPKESESSQHEPKGWYSRDYLPHLDNPKLIQFITFRLHDALPMQALKQIEEELKQIDAQPSQHVNLDAERRKRLEAYLDAGYGACYLRDERIARLVQGALCYFDGQHYRLLAWCIMPNHVHVVVEMLPGFSLAQIVHSWKTYTARAANKLLHREGPFWQREYYDRYMRDERHLAGAIAYVEQNPVKAGLVVRAEDWPFGSARLRKA